MKPNKFALTLTVAALLPTFAHAGADPVLAGFERDMYREQVLSAAAATGQTDSLADIFNTALNGTSDPVLASFERDMYREPVLSAAAATGQTDSLADIFNVALRPEVDQPARQVAIRGNHHGG